MNPNQEVVFDNVSKFYGDVLGVNRITLSIPPGITSLVGPNGSGKTTLMNLMTGLLQPTRGSIRVLGVSPEHPEQLFRQLGYCTQFDSFPRGFTGYQFVYSFLRIYGCTHAEAEDFTWRSIDRAVGDDQLADMPPLRLTRKAAKKGDLNATVNIGAFYVLGIGLPQNAQEARKWFEKGVNAG